MVHFHILSLSVSMFLLWLSSCSYCDQFKYYSALHFTELLQKQKTLIHMLEKCLEEEKEDEGPNFAIVLGRYIDNFRKLVDDKGSSKETIYHPVNALQLIRHAKVDWWDIDEHFGKKQPDCLKELMDYRDSNDYPSEFDVKTIAAIVGRIWFMHKLDTTEVIKGWIRLNNRSREGFKSKNPLDWKDTWLIGITMAEKQYYKEAVTWLNATLGLLEHGSHEYDHISGILKKIPEQQLGENYGVKATNLIGHLCRGETLKHDDRDSALVCRYLTRNRGFLMIGPMKLEELSRDPPLMMFHDLMTKKETERFIDIRAPYFDPRVPQRSVAFHRLSQHFQIDEEDHTGIPMKVSRRIEESTGLFVSSKGMPEYAAEPFQVSNYGVGGAFMIHEDFANDQYQTENDNLWVMKGGNRIATALIYLNDVELGGATVFPLAGTTVWPKRGSAIFFYNLFKNGTGDGMAQHAGCPVLYGQKWVSNKFIHMNRQDKLQCGVSRDEKHGLL